MGGSDNVGPPLFERIDMAEAVQKLVHPHNQRKALVDNSLEVGGPTVLGVGGKYMRHLPSGRVYPYEEEGAKRDDVEVFLHTAKGDVKINKPPKPVAKGPFQRGRKDPLFDVPGDRVLDVASE